MMDPDRGLIAWFAHNHVAANLLMLFIVTLGIYGALNVTVETMPNIQFDQINIQVPYLGAAPAEVEEGVVIKVEEAIEDVEGVRRIRSVAREGMGQVTVDVADGFDVAEVLNDLKLAVDGISTLPAESERPVLSKFRFRRGAITVQISGDVDEAAMKRLADQIRDEIVVLDEVTYAEVWGSRPFEISVEVDEPTLRQYGLTIDQVAQTIRSWSVDLPGGNIRSEGGDIRLRTKGQAYTGRQFGDIVLLSRPDGTRVRLADVAAINDGFAEVDSHAYFDGQPSLGIAVMSSESENEIDVADAVKRYVAERRLTLPEGIRLDTWADATYHLQGRLDMMAKNMALGVVLVMVILGLFLHLRFAFWVVMGLPVAFLGAMMLLPTAAVDISINVVSLFGFILVLGIVVDDAIIIAESVYAETERNGYTLRNIVAGTQRVAVPATFGVLTTIMAFLPMLFVTGPMQKMVGSIGWVVVLCLAFSLVESKLILPSHLAMMKSSHGKAGLADRVDQWLFAFIERVYRPALGRAIQHRYLTLALFVALLVVTVGVVGGGYVRFVFFPDIEDDYLNASLELYDGAPEAQVRQVVERMTAALDTVSEDLKRELGYDGDIVDHVFAYVSNGTQGRFQVELSKHADRPVTPFELETRWREALGDVAGTKELRFTSKLQSGGGPPIAFKLTGRDYPALEQAAKELVAHLKGYAGVFQVESTSSEGPREISLSIKPEAEALGVTMADLGRQVRAAFYGAEAQRIQRGNQEVRVMVRYPRGERGSIGDLESMWIRLADGRELPFSAVADYQLARGYNSIQRIDGERAVTVTARADSLVIEPSRVVAQVSREFLPQLEAHYPGVRGNLTDSADEERVAMAAIITAFGIALFGIYALIAIPLKSYLQPLIIMGVIPFGIVGAVIGHLLLDLSLSMISLFGIVALSGVVVNDSLIMVDFVNKAVAGGAAETDAALDAGAARFRAILLTSLTTFFGLFPMVLETSMQAQIVIPMAVSLSFGILFATFITLILVPALYLIAADVKRLAGGKRAGGAGAAA